jgi:hypothetical protein
MYNVDKILQVSNGFILDNCYNTFVIFISEKSVKYLHNVAIIVNNWAPKKTFA